MNVKGRADKILFEKGLVSSRSQVKSLIQAGQILVNGKPLTKAGELIDPSSEITINTPLYVGRGALKLEHALSEFKVSVENKIVMDVGASTGGFTEILLKNGAKLVYAIDVGHGQLAGTLREDPRVINMEGVNIKELQSLPTPVESVVVDVSFISVTKILDSIQRHLILGGDLIVLVKPQFEAGKEHLPKDGVIKDSEVHHQVLEKVINFSISEGWEHCQTIDSPIEGKSGNKEFFCWFKNLKDQDRSEY